MTKPREWWIHSTGNAYTMDVSSSFPVVHVIEKSAYDDLKAAYDELISNMPKIPTEPYEKAMAKEIMELKQQAEKLAEALKEYAAAECHNCMIEFGGATQEDFDKTPDFHHDTAIKALAEWKKFKENK